MWTLLLALSYASDAQRHGPEDRVLVDTLRVGAQTAPLVLGPCGAATCALQVEGSGPGRAEVWRFDRVASYGVVDMDHGWMVQTGNPEAFSLAWEPFPGVAPAPTAMVHIENSPEHVIDRWALVALGDTPTVLWRGGGMHRTIGPADVRPMRLKDATWVVETAVVGRETAGQPHDDARIEAYRYEKGHAELVAVPEAELPLFAVVVASFPTPAAADTARGDAKCLRPWWQLDSSLYPKLAPGLTVLAKLTPDRALADRWLTTAKACRSDAYVKPAR